MTIQIPNPGTGNGATGDNEYVMWQKVGSNFNDQSNAASRLVGKGTGNIPSSDQVFEVFSTAVPQDVGAVDLNTLAAGSYVWLGNYTNTNAPTYGRGHVQTYKAKSNYRHQVFFSFEGGNNFELWMRQEDRNNVWGRWRALTENTATYSTTTAAGANVVVDSSGKLMRSTSSERYKDVIADLVLTDDAYANAMSLPPIVYRSTADADNADWHFYSFSAEALGAFDPAFVLWRQTEIVTDADGNMTEQPLAEPQAEGLNINALLAFNHAIAIKQDEMIKALTARVNDLAQKLEA